MDKLVEDVVKDVDHLRHLISICEGILYCLIWSGLVWFGLLFFKLNSMLTTKHVCTLQHRGK